jgi:Porin subfamily
MIMTRPSCGVGWLESIKLFLPNGEAKYFSDRGWTLICPTGLFAKAMPVILTTEEECGCLDARAGMRPRRCSDRCNPDFNIAQLGVVTRWTPVKNLTFSADVMWTDLDQKFTGSAILTPTAPKPTATYEYKDQDTVTFNVRAQRNF